MKGFFKRLPLPAKLVLLGAIPLLFLMVVVLQYNTEKREKIAMLDGYRQRIRQAIDVNALIDALQNERRYSFMYALNGTQQNEMLQYRTPVDEAIQRLKDSSETISKDFEAYTFLDKLADMRSRVNSREVKAEEVLQFYSNSIFRLSTMNSVAAGNVIYLEPIMETVASQKVLSDIITYKGMLLAQLYLYLETGGQNKALLTNVYQYQDMLASYLYEFRQKAPEKWVTAFNAVRSDTTARAALAIEQRFRQNPNLDTVLNPFYYWEVATKTVNQYKQVQLGMMEEGRHGANVIYEEEKRQQTLSLVMLVLVMCFVVSFIVYT
ncbi:MAG: hypothetical protein EOO14_10550, partial [Chitinophagaceae bacterium]